MSTIMETAEGDSYKTGVNGIHSAEEQAYGVAKQMTSLQAADAKVIVDQIFMNHKHQHNSAILAAVLQALATNFAALVAARK